MLERRGTPPREKSKEQHLEGGREQKDYTIRRL